jgi:hypothetical protein
VPALVLLVLLFGLPLGLFALAIEDQPAATAPTAADHTDVDRLRELFRRNDPRRFRPGERREVVFTERDMNLALRHGLARTERVQARVGLVSGAAEMAFTVRLPANPLGRFFNLTARVASGAEGLVVERCAAGRVSLPAWLVNPALRLLHRGLLEIENYRIATTAVHDVELRPGALRVDLVWHPELSERLRESGAR